MREVDLLLLLVPFEHREVDDPAELELLLGHQLQLGPDPGAGQAGELGEHRRIAGHEEGGVAALQAQLHANCFCRFRSDVLCNRPSPFRPFPVTETAAVGIWCTETAIPTATTVRIGVAIATFIPAPKDIA